jgi:phosphohistidine phosphatase
MKQLILIRHAKAVSDSLYVHDFERILHGRGEQDAPIMGSKLADKNLLIDAMISSPAYRAKSTAELIATAIDFPLKNIQFQPLIYEASTRRLFQIACELNDDWKTVILIGHNPAFYDLASSLLGKPLIDFPTCAVCGLTFNIEKWADLQLNSGELAFFETPKDKE